MTPALLRYLHWLGGVLATGDLGHSLVSDRPIATSWRRGILNTVLLSIYAAFILYVRFDRRSRP